MSDDHDWPQRIIDAGVAMNAAESLEELERQRIHLNFIRSLAYADRNWANHLQETIPGEVNPLALSFSLEAVESNHLIAMTEYRQRRGDLASIGDEDDE